MGSSYGKTVDGFEQQFGTNHIGHQYLTSLLLDKLKESTPGRIISLSSLGHRLAKTLTPDTLDLAFRPTESEYWTWSAYGNSKLGNILMTRVLNSRYAKDGVTAYAVHPGVVQTELARDMWSAKYFYAVFGKLFVKQSEEGAGTTIYCATSDEVLEHAGKFFSVCTPIATSAQGMDDTLAEALWNKTEQEIATWKAKQNSSSS